MHRHGLLFVILGAISATSCDVSTPKPTTDIRERLVGTWLSELDEDGGRIRSVVTLNQEGKFREVEKIFEPNGQTKLATHTGEWFFDGTNFKRKYTSSNGQSLSNSQFAYVTYAVKSSTNSEFVGADNVRQKEVRFVRADAETQP